MSKKKNVTFFFKMNIVLIHKQFLTTRLLLRWLRRSIDLHHKIRIRIRTILNFHAHSHRNFHILSSENRDFHIISPGNGLSFFYISNFYFSWISYLVQIKSVERTFYKLDPSLKHREWPPHNVCVCMV